METNNWESFFRANIDILGVIHKVVLVTREKDYDSPFLLNVFNVMLKFETVSIEIYSVNASEGLMMSIYIGCRF